MHCFRKGMFNNEVSKVMILHIYFKPLCQSQTVVFWIKVKRIEKYVPGNFVQISKILNFQGLD